MKKIDTEFNKKTGERVRQCREAKRLTRKQLGELVHISAQHIYNIETGRRGLSMENAVLFAPILGVSVAYLLCKSDYPDSSSMVNDLFGKYEDIEDAVTELFSLWLKFEGFRISRTVFEMHTDNTIEVSFDKNTEIIQGGIEVWAESGNLTKSERNDNAYVTSYIFSRLDSSEAFPLPFASEDEIQLSPDDITRLPFEVLDYLSMRVKQITNSIRGTNNYYQRTINRLYEED